MLRVDWGIANFLNTGLVKNQFFSILIEVSRGLNMVFLVGRRERVWCAFLFNIRSTSRAGGGRRKGQPKSLK